MIKCLRLKISFWKGDIENYRDATIIFLPDTKEVSVKFQNGKYEIILAIKDIYRLEMSF